MSPNELRRRIAAKNPPVVVDVRTIFEFKKGHIPGAIHAQTWKIMLRIDRIPSDRDSELVLTCEHGPRAEIVRGLLRAFGYRNISLLEGHMSAWRRGSNPMES